MDYGECRLLNGRPRLRMAVWLKVKVRGCRLSLQPTDSTPAATQKRCCNCSYHLWCYV